MASLAEGIQGLVSHMRADQQVMREQMTRQGEQQKQLLEFLRKLDGFFERAANG